MLRGFIRSSASGGYAAQKAALTATGVRSIYADDERDDLVKSLRKGDGVAVARLDCLASSKPDLRWALDGTDGKPNGYRGVFLKKNYVLDLETGAEHRDARSVESVLRATDAWANEARGRRTRPSRGGGRPRKKRTDKHVAFAAWKDLVKYPTMADALASEAMAGWSKSAATRAVKLGGLGPRGALAGRLPKRKKE
jgi:hypothetical protein